MSDSPGASTRNELSPWTTDTRSDEFFRALSEERRRVLLSVLTEAESPVPESTLAERVVAREADEPVGEVATDDRERVHASLRHVHLPTLETIELIEHDPDDGTVTVRDHPVWEDPAIRSLLETRDHFDSGEVDELLTVLASDQRRAILSLFERESQLGIEEVADALAARDIDGPSSTDERARLLVDLVHVQVPMLDDADVVSFDPDRHVIRYTGHRFLDEWWSPESFDEGSGRRPCGN